MCSYGETALASLACAQCAAVFHATAAELYAAMDDYEAARREAEAARSAGEQFGREATILAADRATASVELAAGNAAQAITILDAAMQRAGTLAQPYELARTAAVLGRAYLAAGGEERARESLGQALDVFDRLGALPDATAVRETVRALGQPV